AHGEADELGEVEYRHVDLCAGGLGGAVLLAVQVEVAERAGNHHGVGALGLGLVGVLGGHGEGVLVVDGSDGETAALALAGNVHDSSAQNGNDLLDVLLAGAVLDDVFGTAQIAAVEG